MYFIFTSELNGFYTYYFLKLFIDRKKKAVALQLRI